MNSFNIKTESKKKFANNSKNYIYTINYRLNNMNRIEITDLYQCIFIYIFYINDPDHHHHHHHRHVHSVHVIVTVSYNAT